MFKRFKIVKEGLRRFTNVKESQRRNESKIYSCFGWVVNQEGYGMIALSID